ncbi:MAG: 16S rRNA (cytidine(1402)-2'-O)-methyltransferase [Geminicoccaceae bacterium]|nr:16S rRNA (cytidine(1402)-2'-O)-methyltransferase [Geminicoccaceae bacterium]
MGRTLAGKRNDTRDLVRSKRRDDTTNVAETGAASVHQANADTSTSKLAPGLYVTATPIGNLGDISSRAREVMAAADLVLCEDTRVTGRLLHLLGLKRPLLPYHDHNGERMRPQIIERLLAGESMVLVSDAGTPCIADPGFKLVRAVREVGIPVRSVPGACSVVSALSIAGLPTDRFLFSGFLPSRATERRSALQALRSLDATLVFLESPARISASLADCAGILGPRQAAIGRELTKLHEEVRTGRLDALAAEIAAGPALRGEIVLLIAAGDEARPMPGDEEIDEALRRALIDNKPGRAAAIVARATGISRDLLYDRALLLKT